ncbi:hypothetical protein MCERE10_03660 [Burkholderiaceae bacterium]
MDLQLGLLSDSRSDFTLRIKDLSWCPGPESNRHALRRGILRKRAPLQAIKNGVLKAYGILYNVLYNARSEYDLTSSPLYSIAFQTTPTPYRQGIIVVGQGHVGWVLGLSATRSKTVQIAS